MSCLFGQSLQERYRTAAVEWARRCDRLSVGALIEAEHDKALLDFVRHKRTCFECLSDDPPCSPEFDWPFGEIRLET
jgi:hypothetical protein